MTSVIHIVSGASSAVHAPLITGMLKNQFGYDVDVVLTAGALQFVVPAAFKVVGARSVRGSSDFLVDRMPDHIELSRSAELVISWPTSLAFLSRCSNAMTNDLAAMIVVAVRPNKVLLFPSLPDDTQNRPAVRHVVEVSRTYGWYVAETQQSMTVRGSTTEGGVLSPAKVAEVVRDAMNEAERLGQVD